MTWFYRTHHDRPTLVITRSQNTLVFQSLQSIHAHSHRPGRLGKVIGERGAIVIFAERDGVLTFHSIEQRELSFTVIGKVGAANTQLQKWKQEYLKHPKI